ncbi:MAG TPA: right-handed parallel beta-helix repeat-containing protein [Xanthobacteraceae bacterium]|nr:right-handed parallel beta-helix repeat-containing protein [Xanthobacteraceae bacterium]
MMTLMPSLAIMAAAVGLCPANAPAQAAQALLPHTFVSAVRGDDAGDCTHATPCRTFQRAHDRTDSDGEIMVLDAGDYSALTIDKAITIVNDGAGDAGVLTSDGTGITINAPAAASVNLRGLTIQGVGFGGGSGIRFNSGGTLVVANCFIHNHGHAGIDFFPIGNSNLSMWNTLVADNGGQGIIVRPTGASAVTASFNNVALYNNSRAGLLVRGLDSTGTIDVTVTESTAANNSDGFRLDAGHAAASLALVRAVAADNRLHGIAAVGRSALLRVAASSITGNALSWIAGDGALVQSFGDNTIAGNGDGDPRPPGVPKY